jgi:DNA polymerase III subunit delta
VTALKRSAEVERFLKNPDPSILVALIYGPDPGLVNERVKTLAQSVAGSLDDPFSIIRLNDSDLSGDPGRLLDEANALTFGGSRRIVWIDSAGQNTAKALDILVDQAGESLVVIAADNLKPSAKLRKFAEDKKFAVAIPCFADDVSSLNGMLDEELKKRHLTITSDAQHYFIGLLGADRQLSRREIEKLCLYAANKGEIIADDVRQISGDATAPTLDSLCDAVGEGNIDQTDRIYGRSISSGTNPTAIIGQLIRHFTMLDWIASQTARRNGDVRGYIKQYRPPVFFMRHRSVQQQISLWSHEDLKSALELLKLAESQCRNGNLPTEAVAQRALLSLSMSAKRRHRRF